MSPAAGLCDQGRTIEADLPQLPTVPQTSYACLAKILQKKGWFAKGTSEELRVLTVTILGKIGGDDALNAIKTAYKDSKGNLHSTCKRILESFKVDATAEKNKDAKEQGH